MPPEQVTAWTEQVGTLHEALAIVFPAIYVIGGALMVLTNAALLRIYLARRDPGWLEDGEFESVRWPLGLVGVLGVGWAGQHGRSGTSSDQAPSAT